MTKFWFKWSWTLCLTFLENGSNLVNQKIEKNWNMSFSNTQNICFWAQCCFKNISLEGSFLQILIWIDLNTLLPFPEKQFQLRHSKICKKLKNELFKHSQYSFFGSRLLQNDLLRRVLCPNFDLNRFEHFASLFWKTVSASSLTILEKNWKMLFSNGQNIRFWPQGYY